MIKIKCKICGKIFETYPCLSLKKKFCSKSCYSKWQQGKSFVKFTEDIKRKISEANKGRKNPHTKEWREKMSKMMKGDKNHFYGKRHKTESIEKMKEAIKKQFKNGRNPTSYWMGKKMSIETRAKQSKSHSGNKCYFWRGGMKKNYPTEWNRLLRKTIRERDNYTCQICGNKAKDVHHLNYEKKDCNLDNLITLCHSCHSKTTVGDRENWFLYLYLKKNCEVDMLNFIN